MSLHYTGPSQFRGMFETEYSRMADDYERRPAKITLGLPGLAASSSMEMLKDGGFDSQRQFNRFYTSKFNELKGLQAKLGGGNPKKAHKKKYIRMLDELGNLSHPDVDIDRIDDDSLIVIARYAFKDDVVVIDAFATVRYILLRKDVTPAGDIPYHMRHDLVHFDFGVCEPYVELRKGYKEIIDFTDICFLLEKAESSGPEELAKAKQRSDVTDFLQKLGNPQNDEEICAAAHERLEAMTSGYIELDGRFQDLGIHVGNETFAYSYCSDRETFGLWLRNMGPQCDSDRSLQLYDKFDGMIEADGRLPAFRQVKGALNRSFAENVNLFELFSV